MRRYIFGIVNFSNLKNCVFKGKGYINLRARSLYIQKEFVNMEIIKCDFLEIYTYNEPRLMYVRQLCVFISNTINDIKFC